MRPEHGSRLAALIVLCCWCSAALRSLRQCLYLDEGTGPADVCGARGSHVRLRFCDAYELALLLRPGDACDAGALARFRGLDDRARRDAQSFRRILERYDCGSAGSVSWTCGHCEEAYKQWVCSMYLPPVQVEGVALKPCRSICRLVEQRCPYFHPSVKDQYAGERVFKCIDPDIPDLQSIQGESSYGPPNRCYCPQHLDAAKGDSGEAECRLLSPAQLLRNASRRGQHRSGGAPGRPALPLLLMAALSAAWWTRTR